MPAPRTALSPAVLTDPGLRGTVRVVGGPGTGRRRCWSTPRPRASPPGVDPESVLLLTGSGRLTGEARSRGDDDAARPRSAGPAGGVASRWCAPCTRYAFAVLRLAAQRNGDPPPRLITSAEQDGIIRELLAGDLEDGADASVPWPPASAARARHGRVRQRTA